MTNLRNGRVLYRLEVWTDAEGVDHIRLQSTHPPQGLGPTLYEFEGRLPTTAQDMGLSAAEIAAYEKRAEEVRNHHRILLADLRRYFHTHYGESHSLKSVAAALETSETTLGRACSENDTTVMNELRQRRLEVAAQMFRENKPIHEVAAHIGVAEDTLSEQFGKHFGQTIREYKREVGAYKHQRERQRA